MLLFTLTKSSMGIADCRQLSCGQSIRDPQSLLRGWTQHLQHVASKISGYICIKPVKEAWRRGGAQLDWKRHTSLLLMFYWQECDSPFKSKGRGLGSIESKGQHFWAINVYYGRETTHIWYGYHHLLKAIQKYQWLPPKNPGLVHWPVTEESTPLTSSLRL